MNKETLLTPRQAAYRNIHINWHLRAWVVRRLRIILPAMALVLAIALILWAGNKSQDSVVIDKSAQNKNVIPNQNTWDNVLLTPRFTSRDKKGRPFLVTAERALQDDGENTPILLEEPKAHIDLSDDEFVDAKASLGRYDADARFLTLTSGVKISLNNDKHWLKSDEVEINLDEYTVNSTSAVTGGGENMEIVAYGLNGNMDEGFLDFIGAAKAVLSKGKNKVIIVAQDAISWHRDDKLIIASGTPSATNAQGTTINADVLEAKYEEKPNGGVKLTDLYAKGAVVISTTAKDGAKTKAFGEFAHYDVLKDKGKLTGGDLRIVSHDGSVLRTQKAFLYNGSTLRFTADGGARLTKPSGEWVTADNMAAQMKKSGKAGKLELSEITANGNIVAMQGGNIIKGQRATIDAKTGVATIKGQGKTKGRAKAIIYPDDDAKNLPKL